MSQVNQSSMFWEGYAIGERWSNNRTISSLNSSYDSAAARADQAVVYRDMWREQALSDEDSVRGFQADDAALRAVVRNQLQALRRDGSNASPLLDKTFRDKVYNAAQSAALSQAAGESEIWKQGIANRNGVLAIISACDAEFKRLLIGVSIATDAGKASVYAEVWDAELVKSRALSMAGKLPSDQGVLVLASVKDFGGATRIDTVKKMAAGSRKYARPHKG